MFWYIFFHISVEAELEVIKVMDGRLLFIIQTTESN